MLLKRSVILDLSHRYHLFSKIILVFTNGSFPPCDRLVLTDHDVFGNFVEKSIKKLAGVGTIFKTHT